MLLLLIEILKMGGLMIKGNDLDFWILIYGNMMIYDMSLFHASALEATQIEIEIKELYLTTEIITSYR